MINTLFEKVEVFAAASIGFKRLDFVVAALCKIIWTNSLGPV